MRPPGVKQQRVKCKCGRIFFATGLNRACPDCRNERRRVQIIDKLMAFYERHGCAPTAKECGAGVGNRQNRDRSLPDYSTLCTHFGSFRQALLAAGITPRPHGWRKEFDHKLEALPKVPRKKTVQVRAGPPVYANTNRIDCPVDRAHRPEMVYVRHHGVITGQMVAWCHECRREIPNQLEPVEAERRSA